MSKENGVWSIVFYDAPVGTDEQRREANRFRLLLKENGYSMYQFSVYTRYAISISAHQRQHNAIRAGLPQEARVTILNLSDRAWARAQRFTNFMPLDPPQNPSQLHIF